MESKGASHDIPTPIQRLRQKSSLYGIFFCGSQIGHLLCFGAPRLLFLKAAPLPHPNRAPGAYGENIHTKMAH